MMTWWRAFWRGLSLGVRPLVDKELRARSRGMRPVVILTVYLLALALGATGALYLMVKQGGAVDSQLGLRFFLALSAGFVVLLCFTTPALTTGSISGERERKTLDLLLVTGASPLGIALGKLTASVIYVVYLLLASLPSFALVYLCGGPPLRYLALALVSAGVTAVAFAALGLFCSALLRRTQAATVVAYLVVLFLVFGIPFVNLVYYGTRAQSPDAFTTPSPLAYASPLVGVLSVSEGLMASQSGMLFRQALGVAIGGGAMAGRDTFTAVQFGTRVTYVTAPPTTPGGQPTTVELPAPWVYHYAYAGGLVLLAVAVSAWRLRVAGPLARRRIRRATAP